MFIFLDSSNKRKYILLLLPGRQYIPPTLLQGRLDLFFVFMMVMLLINTVVFAFIADKLVEGRGGKGKGHHIHAVHWDVHPHLRLINTFAAAIISVKHRTRPSVCGCCCQ